MPGLMCPRCHSPYMENEVINNEVKPGQDTIYDKEKAFTKRSSQSIINELKSQPITLRNPFLY